MVWRHVLFKKSKPLMTQRCSTFSKLLGPFFPLISFEKKSGFFCFKCHQSWLFPMREKKHSQQSFRVAWSILDLLQLCYDAECCQKVADSNTDLLIWQLENSVNSAVNEYVSIKGTFHMQCPQYNRPLTPTAPLATMKWETYIVYPCTCNMCSTIRVIEWNNEKQPLKLYFSLLY